MNNKNELQLISEQTVLDKEFGIYGDLENPLFLAKDVAEWIEHNKPYEMILNVDEDEKLKAIISLSGQNREVWMLTEDGLYEVLMQSRKPIAKQFKTEVKKLLRTLRKTGGYISNAELMVNTYFSTLPQEQKIIVQGLFSQIENQQKQIEEQKPLVTFAETALKSSDNILMRELSKVAKDEGLEIGQNRLFRKLREWNLIMKDSTEPYQYGMDRNWFVVEENSVHTPYGVKLTHTTKVTPKGQVYIIEKLKKELTD